MHRSNKLVLSLVLVAALAAGGCAKKTDTEASATSAPSAAVTLADAGHGKALFAANCAVCHGAAGVDGGVGPALKYERLHKKTAAVIAQIKNPQPPMPKLYPGTLSEKDVADVAAYVETL